MSISLPGLEFPAVCSHKVAAHFDGGDVSSDAGVMLLAQADRALGLTADMASSVSDARQASKVRYDIGRILAARVYGIACGYEDANDHDSLRDDPLFKLACNRLPAERSVLASQPTISRAENAVSARDLVRMAKVLARKVIERIPAGSDVLYLDVDATDDPCHGQQEFGFYNGHYGNHCYLPLHLHVTGADGRQWLLASVLRPGRASYKVGLFSLLRRAIRLLRERFPDAIIVLRADAGFGFFDTMAFCEQQGVDYLLGTQTNERLATLSTPVQIDVCLKYRWEGDGCREYGQFDYKARTWPHKRKVVVKAEITLGKLQARYVVTSLDGSPKDLYLLYCERGDRENRIKELKLDLFSGRTSCHRFIANMMRLLMHTAAALLMSVIQTAAQGTQYARAQVSTLRQRVLKVAVRVVQTCRRVCLQLPTSYPDKAAWVHINHKLSSLVT
jgi:hypothetical protein